MDLDLIFMNVDAQNDSDIISLLGNKMLEKGYVKDTYVDAVIERESILPTGLDIGDLCVAIPHTQSEHVNSSVFAVGIPKKSVKFKSMIDPSKTIDAQIVFLLAINDPDGQVELLQNLMSVFQNKQLLESIKYAKNKEDISKLLEFIKL